MRKGRSLERLVAHLESVLIGQNNVTITSPRRLVDVITGQQREHDVIVEITNGHHVNLIAFECRDRTRPIGADAVEAFAKKCEHTKVNKGIMVSSSGFRKPATDKARFLGIECFGLDQMSSMITPTLIVLCQTMSFRSTHISKIFWHVPEMAGREVEDCKFLYENGDALNGPLMVQRANEELGNVTSGFAVGNYKYNIKFPCEGLFLHEKSTGLKIPVDHMIAIIDFEILNEEVPLQHFKYSDKASGSDLANVSIAKGTIGDKALNIVLHAEPDGRVSVSLFAENESK
jgi:Restriction endonuclease